MKPVYKILTTDQWTRFNADSVFEGAPIDLEDGYIHLSASHQVRGTLEKHFAGQAGLWIVEFDADNLGDSLRWEVSRGGDHFPHLYRQLKLAQVRSSVPAEQFSPAD